MWDDWGGWFDPVPPVYEDYDGLGFRVPLIVVSPYAKHGYVTHVQYETASVLRFIEDNFGLPPLAASGRSRERPGRTTRGLRLSRSIRARSKRSRATSRRRTGCTSNARTDARDARSHIIGDD